MIHRYISSCTFLLSVRYVAEIYAFTKQVQKSAAYGAMVHRAPNTLTLIDKKQHGRKRRTIAQGFGDNALRGFEDTMMGLVRTFSDSLVQDTSAGEWSSPQNMAKWCMSSLFVKFHGRIQRTNYH